jgi:hypothetical protein
MFVLMEIVGEHYDASTDATVCSNDRSKLDAYITDFEKKRAVKIAFGEKLWNFYQAFVVANPQPESTMSVKDVPRWKTGLSQSQITPDMRAERNAVQEHNDAVRADQVRLHNEWNEQVWIPAYKAFLVENGKKVPEVIDLNKSHGKIYFPPIQFEIVEIPEL